MPLVPRLRLRPLLLRSLLRLLASPLFPLHQSLAHNHLGRCSEFFRPGIGFAGTRVQPRNARFQIRYRTIECIDR